ncbi:hypothetical protein DXG01_001737 [Tephrocybe rancida]|nr:hypothetical protein DXG01_001737 [Tephrocybe rancida]
MRRLWSEGDGHRTGNRMEKLMVAVLTSLQSELVSCFIYQVGALCGFLKLHGLRLNHIKPHGAIYGQASRSLPLARAVVEVIKVFEQDQDGRVAFVGLAGTAHQTAAEEAGVHFIPEWFADLDYSPDGKLIATRKHSSVSLDVVHRMLSSRQITTMDGSYLPLGGDNLTEVTICCHSDTPHSQGAVEIAQAVKIIVDETMTQSSDYEGQTLLVANRGEIAVRIIRTAKALGIRTIAIYSPSDTLSLHVLLADKAVPLVHNPKESSAEAESQAYLATQTIISICFANAVTLLHPGYGFLSENAVFASAVINAGITWLGPRPDVIQTMGLKHEARAIAALAGVPILPGSNGLLSTVDDALEAANHIGYPVLLKASAGGGGIGMVICEDDRMVRDSFHTTQTMAKVFSSFERMTLFGMGGLFIEKYVPAARHIEIQVFGNGLGDIVHMGERECSLQRRHQKIIEESPSPFMTKYPALKHAMCDAAVEHPVTEVIYPSLDLVKLMIDQGIYERRIGKNGATPDMQQETYDQLKSTVHVHAIEGRIYAENPFRNFLPSPGLLQLVELDSVRFDWLRVESWITTGLSVTPFFDGLLCKIIVTGRSRQEAIDRFVQILDTCKVYGPPNNVGFLKAVATTEAFQKGRCTTSFLSNFVYQPRVVTVISAGIQCTVQDLPGRTMGLGIPRGGPMDPLAFSAGNRLVGNPVATEGLEILILPNIACELEFSAATVVAITGKQVRARVNDALVNMWSRIIVPRGCILRLDIELQAETPHSGFRIYLSIRGGFPSIPSYLGSKSTSMGLGGYQGRPLISGDQLALGNCGSIESDEVSRSSIPHSLIPRYRSDWVIYVLPGPQDDEEFLTSNGRDVFYSTKWHVSLDSNRLGLRLASTAKVRWARADGGEGGSHPSNILDNAYVTGTININGDTPVILTNDGPDMGGYVSICTVASADLWKLGQVQPGNTIIFRRISWTFSQKLQQASNDWDLAIASFLDASNEPAHDLRIPWSIDITDTSQTSILHREGQKDEQVTYRQVMLVRDLTSKLPVADRIVKAGDSSILVEFGPMKLDLDVRARIHAFQARLGASSSAGLLKMCPCIRSIMCHYDARLVSQSEFLTSLVAVKDSLPTSVAQMSFPGRRISFPIVLDDPWNQEALRRYTMTVRQKAVYLPSNVDYLAKNNGLEPEEALKRLVESDWLVLGVGFYLGCPFLVPGAIGIAGPVAAIYPVESPGGYQLYGRTLPAWQTTFSMEEYRELTHSISDQVLDFQERQRTCSLIQNKREQELLSEWEIDKQAISRTITSGGAFPESSTTTINAPLFASVGKIKCQPGDRIKSAGDILLVLEAMKMEIPVRSGEANVGKTIERLGEGIMEGASVRLGDVLLILS